MTKDPSRWWYSLVPFPVLVGVRYVLGWLTATLLPTAGPGRSDALPVLFLALSSSLVGALVVATAPLFAAGVVLDVRALRDRSSWTPHWAYGILGAVPLLGIFVEWVAVGSIPAAIGYLALRRRSVGYPLGRRPPADGETSPAPAPPATRTGASTWRYGVVVPPVLELTGAVVSWTVRTTGMLRQGSDPLVVLVPVSLTLIAAGLVPLFAVSLSLDATAVRDASGDTVLDPRIWGALGLGSLLGLVIVGVTFMPVIALAYVARRRLAAVSSS